MAYWIGFCMGAYVFVKLVPWWPNATDARKQGRGYALVGLMILGEVGYTLGMVMTGSVMGYLFEWAWDSVT